MSEPNPIYESMADQLAENGYVSEAIEMLGKGYDQEYIRKELPAVMSGFTPAPDVLITEFGFVTALVWGKVWRYCQMSDGICRAKLETLAGQLGMSVRTIIRHIEPLVRAGYLKDITPELKNRPHIYADTGKVRIRISVEATMTKSHSTMTESHSRHDRESLEESKVRKNKEELAKTSFEAAIFGGVPIDQEQFEKENNRNVAPRMFEKALGFSKPLPWWSNKEWSEFADWVVAEYSRSKTSFGEYNTWRNEKFTKGGIANTRLRGFPSEFSDSWDMFLMSKPQPTQSQEPAPKSFPTLVNGRVQR